MVIIFQGPSKNDHYFPKPISQKFCVWRAIQLYAGAIRQKHTLGYHEQERCIGIDAGVICGNHRVEGSYGADWPGTILCGLVSAARTLPGCSRSRRKRGPQGGSARRKRTPSGKPLRKSDRLQGIPTSISLPYNIPLLSPGDEIIR